MDKLKKKKKKLREWESEWEERNSGATDKYHYSWHQHLGSLLLSHREKDRSWWQRSEAFVGKVLSPSFFSFFFFFFVLKIVFFLLKLCLLLILFFLTPTVCNFPGMARKKIERDEENERDRRKKKMRETWKRDRERRKKKKKKAYILDHYYREKMQGHFGVVVHESLWESTKVTIGKVCCVKCFTMVD